MPPKLHVVATLTLLPKGPTLPVFDQPLDDEDEPGDVDTSIAHGGRREGDGWDDVKWMDILKLGVTTNMLIPPSTPHAVATALGKYAKIAVEGSEDDKLRAWKILFAMDPILFSDAVAQRDDQRSRAAKVSEKLSLMETGQWGAVWALVECRHRDGETQDSEAATLRNEISKAAAAAWGASGGARASDAVAKMAQVRGGGSAKWQRGEAPREEDMTDDTWPTGAFFATRGVVQQRAWLKMCTVWG